MLQQDLVTISLEEGENLEGNVQNATFGKS